MIFNFFSRWTMVGAGAGDACRQVICHAQRSPRPRLFQPIPTVRLSTLPAFQVRGPARQPRRMASVYFGFGRATGFPFAKTAVTGKIRYPVWTERILSAIKFSWAFAANVCSFLPFFF
jgi:hypothetical protein